MTAMMPPDPDKTILHVYSLASPWAFLGTPRLMDIAAAAGAGIESVPISTFKDNGWVPLWEKPDNRRAYVMTDLARWARHLGVPMVLQGRPERLANAADALPMVWAAQVRGLDPLPISLALQTAYWLDCADIGRPEGRIAAATRAGFDGAALAAMEDSDAVAAQREAMFARARAAGVFGSPSYIYAGEIFWGQDRLDFLARAMAHQEEPA